MQHIKKNDSHDLLISGTSIFETEQHDCIRGIANGSLESSLFKVDMVHFGLLIHVETIYIGEH